MVERVMNDAEAFWVSPGSKFGIDDRLEPDRRSGEAEGFDEPFDPGIGEHRLKGIKGGRELGREGR